MFDIAAKGVDSSFDADGVFADDRDLLTTEFDRAIGDIGFDLAIRRR